MQQGELSLEPEKEVYADNREESQVTSNTQNVKNAKKGTTTQKSEHKAARKQDNTLQEDDFFETGDASRSASEESDADSASDSER